MAAVMVEAVVVTSEAVVVVVVVSVMAVLVVVMAVSVIRVVVVITVVLIVVIMAMVVVITLVAVMVVLMVSMVIVKDSCSDSGSNVDGSGSVSYVSDQSGGHRGLFILRGLSVCLICMVEVNGFLGLYRGFEYKTGGPCNWTSFPQSPPPLFAKTILWYMSQEWRSYTEFE
jgi:hypothetical protein